MSAPIDRVGNETDTDMDGAWPLPTARPWPPNHPARPTAAPVSEMRVVLLDPEPTGTPETIYWQRSDCPPDADLTVLLCLESAEAGRSVECGWWDGEQWCLCECGGPAVQEDVRAWAEVMGP